MIDWLDETQAPCFPSTQNALAEPNGLLAAGGNITPLWLDQAYYHGVFPWHDPDDVRLWWSPAPRAVITPDSFRLPRTVRKLLKRHRHEYSITMNLAFRQVITACSAPRDYDGEDGGSWIGEDMIEAYCQLQRSGRAVSFELWNAQGELSGGFYGVVIGRVLFGESMFSRQANASKLLFAQVAGQLFECGIELIDCQMQTTHLAQFGAQEISREEFEQRLGQARDRSLLTPLTIQAGDDWRSANLKGTKLRDKP